jgi:hypothetical protein
MAAPGWEKVGWSYSRNWTREREIELLKLASNDLVQKWWMSKRVNSPRAEDNDPTLIEKSNWLSNNE